MTDYILHTSGLICEVGLAGFTSIHKPNLSESPLAARRGVSLRVPQGYPKNCMVYQSLMDPFTKKRRFISIYAINLFLLPDWYMSNLCCQECACSSREIVKALRVIGAAIVLPGSNCQPAPFWSWYG